MSMLDSLWRYQEAELALERVETEIKTTPARIKLNKLRTFLTEQQGQISVMEKQIEARRAALYKLAAAFDEIEKQSELEQSEFETMAGDEECTAAEMTESRRSIEALLERVNRTRKEIYDTIVWLEKSAAEMKNTWQKAGKAKKEYDALRAACEKELNDSQPRLDAAKAHIVDMGKVVSPDLMAKYNAAKKNHAAPMAIIENGQCGGCNMSLPTSVMRRIAGGDSVVECDNCGRILYVQPN